METIIYQSCLIFTIKSLSSWYFHTIHRDPHAIQETWHLPRPLGPLCCAPPGTECWGEPTGSGSRVFWRKKKKGAENWSSSWVFTIFMIFHDFSRVLICFNMASSWISMGFSDNFMYFNGFSRQLHSLSWVLIAISLILVGFNDTVIVFHGS